MKNVEKVKPTGLFTNYIYKAIPLAFDESMSYYETLCGLLNYLKETVIPALNNNADAIIEVQALMTELQNYVNNYFDNLDVQEEINNKLDEMVEDGTLQNIIVAYLQIASVLGYDTVSDMVESTNLIEGSICKTLGEQSYNDGKGAFYRIRTLTVSDVIDGINIIALDNYETLIAELVSSFNSLILSFDTISDMKSNAILKNGDIVKTLGYRNKNDGGSALYTIRTKTNDDVTDEMTKIALSDETLIAEIVYQDAYIDVKQFGAYCDNDHDDTNAIQKAIDYLASKNGGTVFIPSGTLIITNPIRIESNIHLTGVKGKSIIKASNSFTDVTYQAMIVNKHTPMNLSETHDDSIIIDNLKFDNNGKANAGHDGLIQFRGVTNSKIKDIEMIVNGNNCWGVILFSANQQVTVDSVRIDNVSEDNSLGGCLWVRSGLIANGDENKKSIGLHVTNSTFTSTAKDELVVISEGVSGGWTECEITNCELIGKAVTNLPNYLMVVSPTVSTDNSFVKALLNNITISGKCVNAGIITGYENFNPTRLQAVISNLIINLSAGSVGIQSKDQNQIFTNCKVNVPEGSEACNYGTFIGCNFYGKARGSYLYSCYVNNPTYEGCENCRIVRDSIIYGNTYGLKYYGEFMNPMITNNTIYSNNSGIYGQFASNKGMKNGIISGNFIRRQTDNDNTGTSGIDVRYSTNMQLVNNLVYGTPDGSTGNTTAFNLFIRSDNAVNLTNYANVKISP